jgi:hypothetical protein
MKVGRGRRTACHRLESLERRQLLAATDPVINEFLANNNLGIVDDRNAHSDWIEIYNPGATAADLTNWHLTDSKTIPAKWTFPTGTSVPAGGYLVVFADSSTTSVGPGGKLHTNFSLDANGEYLALTRPDNSVVNEFDEFPKQLGDVSYGTVGGLTQYMKTPTPGAANVGGAIGIAKDTNFTVEHGYYDDPFDLQITTQQSNATIYYTLDGRSPLKADGTISSTAIQYTGPIHVGTTTTLRAVTTAPGYLPSDVDAESYLLTNDIVHQTDAGNVAGFPTQWVNASNAVVSYPQTGQAKYGMTQSVVTKYQTEIANDLKSLPAISIVMNPDDLFGAGSTGTNGIKGIYSNSLASDNGTGIWERPTSAEMIFPDGTTGFQINAGVQMQGGGSRDPSNTPKHSLRLVFKSQYGPSQLNYKVFDDSNSTSFDSLILKAQYNNTWEHWDPAQRNRSQYVHDQWASDVEAVMGDPSKRGRYVQLFLNGVYWGMYSLTEHPNSSWAAENLGGDKDDYDVYDNEAALIDGNSTAWNTMFSMAGAGLATPSAYSAFQQYLDIPSFIDFMILNQYGGNQDWDAHNWYAVRHSRNAGVATNQFGGYRFIAFDSERILESETANVTSLNNSQRPSALLQALKQNVEFRQQFADRVHQLLFNNGPLTPAAAQALYLKETAKVFPGLAAEEARWGTYRKDYRGDASVYYSRDVQWTNEKNRLTVFDSTYAGSNTGYFSVRGTELIKQYRLASNLLYGSFDAPELSQFGGNITAGTKVTIANLAAIPAGDVVYYTTNGVDPRVAAGAISPSAVLYPGNSTGITVNASQRLLVRAYNPTTKEWSAITNAAFYTTAAPKLRVTEIMYNPAPPPVGSAFLKDDYEFLELQNTGTTAINPSGIVISNGIDFTFPAGSASIPAGGRVVLVRNPAAFASRYGSSIPIAGTYTGELSDSSDTLTLATGLGQAVQSFTYKDGWFDQTDGDGFSLVAIDPSATDAVLSTKDGWRAGQPQGGNPGGADVGLNNNSVVISEVLSQAIGGTNWIEFQNTTDAAINIGGWFLSDDNLNRQKFTLPATFVIAPHAFASIAQTGGFGAAFNLSSLGGSVYLTSSNTGQIGGYRDAVDFGASDPGVSFGRYIKSTVGSDFTALSATTRDAANAYPLVGPVVIDEIMYNPFGVDREYLELRNVTDADVTLDGWQFSDGINFTFAAGSTILANGYALIVPIDPATFRSTYNIPANVPIFGPYTGALDNGGEKVTLARPGTPVGSVTPYITVDRVNYDNETPWPALPDGQGPSVARIDAVRYGNDPANWRPDLADGTPGLTNGLPPLIFTSNAFAYATAPTVTLKFNKDVGASIAKGDLSLLNRTTGQALDMSGVTFAYDSTTQTATWRLPATLADGNYRATVFAAAVTDAQGRPLDGNADGTGGDDFTTDFFHLTGDANHDRSVDFLDLAKLAQNYNATGGGKTYADGDFNGDGKVDFLDLAKLAQNYNTSLSPAAAAPVSSALPGPSVQEAPAVAQVTAVTPQPTPPITPAPGKLGPKPKSVTIAKPRRVVPAPNTKPALPARPPALGPARTMTVAPSGIFGATPIKRLRATNDLLT